MKFEKYITMLLKNSYGNRIDKDKLKRNIDIIRKYYGIGNLQSSTYQDLANEYNISRQAINNIIDRVVDNVKFNSNFWLRFNDLIKEYLKENNIVSISDLKDFLVKESYVSEHCSIKKLLELNQDFSFSFLNSLGAKTNYVYKANFIVQNVDVAFYSELIKKLNSLPNRVGIINLDDVCEELEKEFIDLNKFSTSKKVNILKYLITNSERLKYIHTKNELWYFNDISKHSNLYNKLRLIKNLTDKVNLEILVSVLLRTYTSRTYKSKIPDGNILKLFLNESSYVDLDVENYVHIKVSASEIKGDEKKLLEVFSKESISYPEFRKRLISKNVSESHVKKLYYSPLIIAKKSAFKETEINLINSVKSSTISIKDLFQERLFELERSTDIDVKEKARREQQILREYLFGGKDIETCAICQNSFPTNYLVTAHKKKRSDCTEDERLDINIVMPICLFGCDSLYENRDILINTNGVVFMANDTHIELHSKIQKLIGKTISSRWREGRNYFI